VCASLLSDALAETEEVMLAAPPDEAPNALVEAAPPGETIEAAPAPLDTETAALAPLAHDANLAELVSIDKALQLLAEGGGGKLTPYLENLMLRLQPLLTFYRETQRSKTLRSRKW